VVWPRVSSLNPAVSVSPQMSNSPDLDKGATPPADESPGEAAAIYDKTVEAPAQPDQTTVQVKKHKARIEHKVPGRIRMRVPFGKTNPAILEIYKEAFSQIPGITTVTTKPATGNIIIHYDTKHEADFHERLSFYGIQHGVPLPGDQISLMANKIKAEADFLAQRSEFAKTTVDFFSNLDKQLKLTTGNAIDLKIVLAGGLAAYTFWEIGATAATPMWVTLALFSLNHFAELHSGQPAMAPAPIAVR
jgi:Heavy metal associated domain 2